MLFKQAKLFYRGHFVPGSFRVEDGRFQSVCPDPEPAGEGLDLRGARVIPGLIDIHTHGNSGADFSDGELEGLKTMARYSALHGVTSFAPTSMTLPYEARNQRRHDLLLHAVWRRGFHGRVSVAGAHQPD